MTTAPGVPAISADQIADALGQHRPTAAQRAVIEAPPAVLTVAVAVYVFGAACAIATPVVPALPASATSNAPNPGPIRMVLSSE